MNINKCWYKGKCRNKCSKSCIRYNLVYTLFHLSRAPEALWEYKPLSCGDKDLKSFQRLTDISNNILEFIAGGNNLYLYSHNCGNGKTSWAMRLMYKYFDEIWAESCLECGALYVNVPHFLYSCKRSISQKVEGFEELCNLISSVDLIIWDDIGDNTATGYEHQILLQYIDGRINAGKSNIYTSNRNFTELQDMLGERLASRIYNCSTIIELKENDKRCSKW
jgi:DNA replication protein DnaC|nr:MAG TPA: Replicative helicase [Caudoviricetes sp.]